MSESYRLFINDDRTVLVRMWRDGQVEVATREDPGDVWGPPALLHEDGATTPRSAA